MQGNAETRIIFTQAILHVASFVSVMRKLAAWKYLKMNKLKPLAHTSGSLLTVANIFEVVHRFAPKVKLPGVKEIRKTNNNYKDNNKQCESGVVEGQMSEKSFMANLHA